MTKVTIYKNVKNECVGFKAFGHAGYAEEGEDIVCAAISILTINTMNAIETFTNSQATLVTDEDQAFTEDGVEAKKETTLVVDTRVLGLQTKEKDENYTEYIE